jgi:hypothetical protein
LALYNIHQVPEALEYVKSLDGQVAAGWELLLKDFKAKEVKTNTAKINTYNTVKYKDYIKDLNRTQIAREDFESVLSNKHKFKVIYTDQDTWLTKDPSFEPIDESPHALFEGL